MTFDEFQATRRHVADVAAATGINLGPDVQSGFVYEGDLHIFDMPDGQFLLVLFSYQTVSDDLAELEMKLFEFARDECNFK